MKENGLGTELIFGGEMDEKFNSTMDATFPSSVTRDVVKAESVDTTKVLYHYIDGFVIEEGDMPFAHETGSLLTKQQLQDIWRKQQELMAEDREEEEKNTEKKLLQKTHVARLNDGVTKRCENCGKVGINHHSARFCSLLCCRRFNIALARRFRLRPNKIKHEETEKIPSVKKRRNYNTPPLSPVNPDIPFIEDGTGRRVPLSPSKWTVDNVCQYMESLPDARIFAKDFREQEIDGSALLLLKEDHLISSLNIKLGPALKLCSHIRKLHE